MPFVIVATFQQTFSLEAFELYSVFIFRLMHIYQPLILLKTCLNLIYLYLKYSVVLFLFVNSLLYLSVMNCIYYRGRS
jgi:hypothetical protein